MGRGKSGSWPLWAAAGATVALAFMLYAVWRSPHRDSYATYGAFAVAVAIVVPGIFAWARRKSAAGQADGAEFDRAVELAVAVRGQWETAAGERGLTGADSIQLAWKSPSLTMAGPSAAAVSSLRFAPLPGLKPATATELESGYINELHALY